MNSFSAHPARGLAARASIGTLLVLGLALLLQVLGALPAHASDYRYWTFWTGDASNTWVFAQKGAADVTVTDGFVEGWRFTISPASGGAPQPRMSPDYNALCPNPDVSTGNVGVAVVVDYGTTDEAPDGETPLAGPIAKCVSVPTGSSAADALAAAVTVRSSSGMVCGIDGYPAQECGVEIKAAADATPTDSPAGVGAGAPSPTTVDQSGLPSDLNTTSSLSPWPWVLGAMGIVIAVLLVGWFFLRIRRNSLPPPRRAATPQQPGTGNAGTSDSGTGDSGQPTNPDA